jgi:hypothetical protein
VRRVATFAAWMPHLHPTADAVIDEVSALAA